MRVMAICAGHFAFAHRHMRRPHKLGAPELMALEAGFHFRRFGQQMLPAGTLRLMNAVARQTRNVPRVVRASLPVKAISTFVALQTGLSDFLAGKGFEIFDRIKIAVRAVARSGRMQRAGTMTGLARMREINSLGMRKRLRMDIRVEIFPRRVA